MEIENGGNGERREFPRGALALGGAGVLGALALSASKGGGLAFAQDAPFKNDIDVLNYALTLEFFEAELYKVLISTGKLQGGDLNYVTLFGKQEQDHVDALIPVIRQLGGTPVTKGNYNFAAAGPVDTREQILDILILVEATGTSAYLGAAGFIKDRGLLGAAASIMQVEARHTALVRRLRGVTPVPDAFTPALTPAQVLAAVAPFFK